MGGPKLMICNVSRTTLFQYLDNELAPGDRARTDDHLASCGDCARLVKTEQEFRRAYLERLVPDPAPPRVRQRVSLVLESLTEQRPASSPRRVRRRAALVAGAIALLLVGLSGGLAFRRAGGDRLGDLAEASVDQHQKLARGTLPFDIATGSVREAEEWFRNKLDFHVAIPDLANEDLAFRGGRISHLREFDVAALGYRVHGADVSLFIIPLEQYRRLKLSDNPKFKILNHRGYDVVVWHSHGTGYSLVSEIGGKACLVCHSPEQRLDTTQSPAAHRS